MLYLLCSLVRVFAAIITSTFITIVTGKLIGCSRLLLSWRRQFFHLVLLLPNHLVHGTCCIEGSVFGCSCVHGEFFQWKFSLWFSFDTTRNVLYEICLTRSQSIYEINYCRTKTINITKEFIQVPRHVNSLRNMTEWYFAKNPQGVRISPSETQPSAQKLRVPSF